MTSTTEEAAIRRLVEVRLENIEIHPDWYTPAGKPRSVPMYEATIHNDYLSKVRTLKSKSRQELSSKCEEQLGKWREQEIKKLLAEAKADALEVAKDEHESEVVAAETWLQSVQGILHATLPVDDRLDWSLLFDNTQSPAFSWTELSPNEPADPTAPEYPKKSFWEWLLPSLKEKRLAATERLDEERRAEIETTQKVWLSQVEDWKLRRANAESQHGQQREIFLEKQRKCNESVEDFKRRFEAGEPDAIIEYLEQVFERSEYPEDFSREYSVRYEPEHHAVAVELALPARGNLSDVMGYKFVAKTRKSTPIRMKKKDHQHLYDEAVRQTVLRTIHEVFESIYTSHVAACTVRGFVTDLNPATGQQDTNEVLTISSSRKRFEELNLSEIDSAMCIEGLAQGNFDTKPPSSRPTHTRA